MALSVVWLAMTTTGCVHGRNDWNNVSEELGITIGIQNVGTEPIDLAYVKFGHYAFRAGMVAPRTKAVHVCSGQSVPDEAEVGYKLKNGTKIVRTVPVKVYLPGNTMEDQDLVLHFNVDGENDVAVEFLKSVHIDGKSCLVPCERPVMVTPEN
jgi:hypothetical protein